MSRVLRAITETPWLATEGALKMVLDVANREVDIEAVSARLGQPLDNARKVEMRGRTAVIPVTGTIVRYSSFFTEICGGVSTESLAKDFSTALDDPNVDNIIFNIDSPGGEASGISELSEMIYAGRSKKKIVAYVDDLSASAGYWIASATSEIYASKTAMVGSIGVVFTIPNKKSDGIEIVSSVSPAKRPKIDTEEGQLQIQKWADKLGEIFVDSVALYRGVGSAKVLSDFGRGDMLIGHDAKRAGMVDEISTFEALITKLNDRRS